MKDIGQAVVPHRNREYITYLGLARHRIRMNPLLSPQKLQSRRLHINLKSSSHQALQYLRILLPSQIIRDEAEQRVVEDFGWDRDEGFAFGAGGGGEGEGGTAFGTSFLRG